MVKRSLTSTAKRLAIKTSLITAYIVQPDYVFRDASLRPVDVLLDEVEGLAKAIDFKVVGTLTARLKKIAPAKYLTSGFCDRIRHEIEELGPNIVIFNGELSPVQQRNLEREWALKVIDRTALILEIFGARAQTKEGRLQVELAALSYQRSRLVRSWTHLERQRGGAGFMGGPGETQIEIDRRLIDERVVRLKKQLDNVRRTRHLGQKNRTSTPIPVAALVGYTNAGKSTLFNYLTDANVMVEDLLFATLDPKMRRFGLPSGQQIVLSDTVGFIADLPTHLIEAFKATLEQITAADVIMHVIDVSDRQHQVHRENVITILEDLGISYESDKRIVEVYNKSDALIGDDLDDVTRFVTFQDHAVMVSALNGEGVDDLAIVMKEILNRDKIRYEFRLEPSEGRALSWLYDHAQIEQRRDEHGVVIVDALISKADMGKFKSSFSEMPKE